MPTFGAEAVASGKAARQPQAPRARKRTRLALALLAAALAVAAGLLWSWLRSTPPQIVTMPGGQKYEFAGVTYGTNHVFGSVWARLARQMPSPLNNFVYRYFGKRLGDLAVYSSPSDTPTPGPTLCVWFRPLGTNKPSVGTTSSPTPYFAKLADEHGVEAGAQFNCQLVNGAWPLGDFRLVPRRSPTLQLWLYQSVPQDTAPVVVGCARFPNPLYGHFPQWEPEPVPAVKRAGDLEVRLDDFETGHLVGWRGSVKKPNGGFGPPFQPAARGEETATGFDFSLRSPRGTNEAWVLQSAELSDATGNLIRSSLFNEFNYGRVRQQPSGWSAFSEILRGTLWPDEAAWRLKLEVKRRYGFAPEEVVTFKNVPVPALGSIYVRPVTNTVGGVQVVLAEFNHHANTSWIQVELPEKPAGVAVDFLGVTSDAGGVKLGGAGGSDFSLFIFVSSIPTNATTLDLTLVVQKTRAVEFLVKPPRPP